MTKTEQRECLYCKRPFTVRHPSQKFCGKRSNGRHLCKDRYHNSFRFGPPPGRDSWSDYYETVHPSSSEAFEE